MKIKALLMALPILAIGMQSCEKNDGSNSGSSSVNATLTDNLTVAVASVASTQANLASTEDVQSVSATNFDSLRHSMGKGMNGFPGGPMKFDLPHISSCATITDNDTVYPKTITIDYGTSCIDDRGHTKSGKIVITISDSMVVAGAVKTINYVDFYIDSALFELSATMKNLGKNDAGNWVIVSEYTQNFTNREGNAVKETFTDTTVWVAGFETADKSDDIFNKTGAGEIKVNDTLAYSRVITKALTFDSSCGYISSGTVTMYKGGNNIVLDYGDGTCDNNATVTTNGISEEINLNTRGFKEGGRFDKQGKGKGGKHGEGRGKFGDGGMSGFGF